MVRNRHYRWCAMHVSHLDAADAFVTLDGSADP